jgi:nucleoid-associated protein YgaU
MSMKKLFTLGAVALLLSGSAQAVSAAEKKMTRDEYKANMAEYIDREAKAQAEIVRYDADVASLQSQISELDGQIADLNAQILDLVDAGSAEVRTFSQQLDGFIRQLEGLMALAPEELVRHGGEIGDIQMQLDELKMSRISSLPEMRQKILRIEGMLSDLNSRTARSIEITYEVERGDHLWGIAGKDDIYGDAYMWPRIYRANRDAIQDPDLIYPQQKLTVPFGVGEGQYLVTQGDFLTKIAEVVYNDPSKWHKIYKANMDQIVEPSLVFPAQVLEIPAN